jgi:hypothetical protein
MSLSILSILTYFCLFDITLSDTFTLEERSIVDFTTNCSSVTLNGIAYRESSGTDAHMTMSLNPGKYETNSDYVIFNGDTIYHSKMTDIIINSGSTVLEDTSFYIDENSNVGISYHIDLLTNYVDKFYGLDVSVNVDIDGKSIHHEQNRFANGVKFSYLEKGYHNVKITVINDSPHQYKSFPSTGDGFVSGRQLMIWKTKYKKDTSTRDWILWIIRTILLVGLVMTTKHKG